MYKYNSIIIFSILATIYLIAFYFINTYVLKDIFYFNYLKNVYSENLIYNIIENSKKINYISYFIYPIILFVKIMLTSIIIYIGVNIFEIKIIIKDCFKISLISEFILSIYAVFKTLYLYIYPPYNLIEIQNFNPFGLSVFFINKSIPKYLLYPLQQLNLFELGYWLLLSYGIKTLGNVEFKKALKVTTLSYGVGLGIWCIFVVFIQLLFS